MGVAFVALGANLGDREGALREAVRRLGGLGAVEAVSSLYETEPVGYLDQPRFLNAAARLRTELAAPALLAGLLGVEAELGRVRRFANAPRTIDLDLLLYDDLVLDSPALTLPHPQMAERAFVLVPLAEIAPDVIHPPSRRRVRDLLARLPTDPGVRCFGSLAPAAAG